MGNGKVWLVGAGPSDSGLLTLKGKEVLQKADVVVYDALVGAEILSMMPKEAEKIYVGKRMGYHSLSQEEINQVLVEQAKEGKRVVRLKGGDPFVFGRGGEELEALLQIDCPFEVVPGVTSAVAVAAYQGIPVTHRDYVSSFHVITGHTKDAMGELPFESYVSLKGTLIFLMGIAALPKIMKGLMEAGMDKNMPACVLSRGTTARQRCVAATVASLEKEVALEVERAGSLTPAIIVVGQVVSLQEKFEWVTKRELDGKRYLITRPADRASRLTKQLKELGAEVVELPSIRNEISDDCEWQELTHLNRYQYLVFTSPFGVNCFFEKLRERNMDIRSLFGMKIAVIGTGTRRELEQHGIFADFMPKEYSGVALGRLLAEVAEDGSHILLARSKIGNPELIKVLEEECKKRNHTLYVKELYSYETIYEKNDWYPVEEAINNHEIDGVFFTSASTVTGFVKANPKVSYEKIPAFCIGQMTANRAAEYGMNIKIAEEATIESMIALAKQEAKSKICDCEGSKQ